MNKQHSIAIHPGILLKQELARRNMSMDEFAERSGMVKAHLCKLFKGESYLSHFNAFQIATTLQQDKQAWVQAQITYDNEQLPNNNKTNAHGTV